MQLCSQQSRRVELTVSKLLVWFSWSRIRSSGPHDFDFPTNKKFGSRVWTQGCPSKLTFPTTRSFATFSLLKFPCGRIIPKPSKQIVIDCKWYEVSRKVKMIQGLCPECYSPLSPWGTKEILSPSEPDLVSWPPVLEPCADCHYYQWPRCAIRWTITSGAIDQRHIFPDPTRIIWTESPRSPLETAPIGFGSHSHRPKHRAHITDIFSLQIWEKNTLPCKYPTWTKDGPHSSDQRLVTRDDGLSFFRKHIYILHPNIKASINTVWGLAFTRWTKATEFVWIQPDFTSIVPIEPLNIWSNTFRSWSMGFFSHTDQRYILRAKWTMHKRLEYKESNGHDFTNVENDESKVKIQAGDLRNIFDSKTVLHLFWRGR